MLYEHQSPAAGTKSLDANELALFFTVRIQYDMDRIARDVLYLLDDVGVSILCRVFNRKFSAPRPKSDIGRRRMRRTLNTAFAPSLRISPWLRGDAVVTTLKPDSRAS